MNKLELIERISNGEELLIKTDISDINSEMFMQFLKKIMKKFILN